MSGMVRLNVNLNTETAQALRDIADQRGISFTEAVRRAISVYKFVADEENAGNTIHVVDERRNEKRQVILL